MELSTEELDFFKNIFTEPVPDCKLNNKKHRLSFQAIIPQSIRKILGNSKLTLLAEINHYQLWFPVSLTINQEGDFSPELGVPEIIDIKGHERSWRASSAEDAYLANVCQDKEIEILSLSCTGITFKIKGSAENFVQLKHPSIEMCLADEQSIKLVLDPVRVQNNIIAAKFKNIGQGRELLRKFLYNSHKTLYSELYQDITL